ncbi:hypothetical protein pEaSNUABM34_00217 [Erwinia phage pEa_SNUABM_34]|nr:hypothetical protein pEaSNUABM34_00217 [Erwinia phage pEa_SNUABM_34]
MIDSIKYQSPNSYKGRMPPVAWMRGWKKGSEYPLLDQFDPKKQAWVEKQLELIFKDFNWSDLTQELSRVIRKTNFPIMWGLPHLVFSLYGRSGVTDKPGSWHKRYAGRVDTLEFTQYCNKKWYEYVKRIQKSRNK